MKKLLTIFAFILFANAQTNVYYPININNATWLRSQSGSTNCCMYYYGIQSGDTIVNSLTYKKLYEQTGNWWPSCGNSQPCFTPTSGFSYIGAIRQDSAAQKVYSLGSNSTEALLYNFNLQVGSIITNANPNLNDTVKKIDSMLVDGSYRKRFFFFDTTYVAEQSFWVEGIGSSGGLFAGIFNTAEGIPALMCFNHNPVPSSVGNTTCTIQLAGINQFEKNNQLHIYPNPAQNNFVIETNYTDKQTLSIFDITGSLVLSKTIYGTTAIDVSGLSAGVYNVSITSGAGVANKHLVVVK